MPQEGQAVPVDDTWRAEVERRLKERGISRAQLARDAKCSRSAITHLLNGDHDQSPIVPRIEHTLDMPPSLRPRTSELERKIVKLVQELDETERIRLYERALAIRDERRR